PAPAAGETVFKLDAFTVHSDGDRGYQSAESISGTRFAISQKNNPFNVQVLGTQFLDEIKPVNYFDAIYYTTGMTGATFFADDTPSVISRGFSNSIFLRDGVRHVGATDPTGFDRVEAVSGPSSVLFGLTAPGGMVNFVSKKPLATRLFSLTQTFGSWNT